MLLPDYLLEGYSSFLQKRCPEENQRYCQLGNEGQSPQTMIVSCCDSRVTPEIIFNSSPGELFVLRNVANLVPPYSPDGQYHGTSSAIEYAVRILRVRNIIVMGHARCGGIQSVLSSSSCLSSDYFIGRWMSILSSAAEVLLNNSLMTAHEREKTLELLSVGYSLANLRSFPFVRAMEMQGHLTLHGLWFDIFTGGLWELNPQSGDFDCLCV